MSELFDVLLADPPWRYEHVRSKSRAIERHYPTMSVDAIASLPVAALVARDAVLFLWSTNPKLPEALNVMAAWGFTYRTSAVWIKPVMGMGYWVRAQHESLLIGARGKMKPPAPALRPRSVIEAPRLSHSAKPPAIRSMIESAFPSARRLELFARERVPGWSAWGNEIQSDVQLVAA